MAAVDMLPPLVFDLRGCPYVGGHPEAFFQTLDRIKPYILVSVSDRSATIRLVGDTIDMRVLMDAVENLFRLGYHVSDVRLVGRWDCGSVRYELEDIVISWDNNSEKRRDNEGKTHQELREGQSPRQEVEG